MASTSANYRVIPKLQLIEAALDREVHSPALLATAGDVDRHLLNGGCTAGGEGGATTTTRVVSVNLDPGLCVPLVAVALPAILGSPVWLQGGRLPYPSSGPGNRQTFHVVASVDLREGAGALLLALCSRRLEWLPYDTRTEAEGGAVPWIFVRWTGEGAVLHPKSAEPGVHVTVGPYRATEGASTADPRRKVDRLQVLSCSPRALMPVYPGSPVQLAVRPQPAWVLDTARLPGRDLFAFLFAFQVTENRCWLLSLRPLLPYLLGGGTTTTTTNTITPPFATIEKMEMRTEVEEEEGRLSCEADARARGREGEEGTDTVWSVAAAVRLAVLEAFGGAVHLFDGAQLAAVIAAALLACRRDTAPPALL